MTYIVIGFVVGMVGFFVLKNNKKIFNRLRARGRDLGETVADSLGDVVDDRKEAIHDRKEVNAKLEGKLVTVLASIDEAKERAEEQIAEAKKYAELSQEAVKAGNDTAAMTFIESQESAEEQAQVFLKMVEDLEGTFTDLKAQLDESKTQVRNAENSTKAFEARHTALNLRKQMTEAAGAFGAAGSLNFNDDELKRQERELNAAEKLSTTASDRAVAEFEASRAASARQNKLEALKRSMSNEES